MAFNNYTLLLIFGVALCLLTHVITAANLFIHIAELCLEFKQMFKSLSDSRQPDHQN